MLKDQNKYNINIYNISNKALPPIIMITITKTKNIQPSLILMKTRDSKVSTAETGNYGSLPID